MSEANKAAVRRIFQDAINKGNVDLLVELSAANYAYHGPGGREIRGHDGPANSRARTSPPSPTYS